MAQSATAPGAAHPVLAALSCLAAVWVVAGSTGLLVHPLRRTLALLGVGAALVVLSPLVQWSWRHWAALAIVVGLSLWAVASPLPPVGVAGIALVLVFLTLAYRGPQREVLWVTCVSVVVFCLYRTALVSIPWFWLAADLVGRGIGRFAGFVTGRPLWVGATFAGLDFLVLTGTLWVIWLAHSPRPRRARMLGGTLALLCGHLLYLVVLSYSTDLLALVPKVAADPHLQQHGPQYMQQQWSWRGVLHKAVPWNLPALAGMIHLVMMGAIFRWTTWVPAFGKTPSGLRRHVGRWAALGGACLLPVVTGLYPGRLSLEDKEIVFYHRTYADWQKPAHGNYGMYSGGMLGLLPAYLESFGARVRTSSDLPQEEIEKADVLIVFCPGAAWADGQLERIWQFVRHGGSLLLLGEHTIHDGNDGNRSNELLRPTGLRVPFDSAMFAVMGWDQSYEALVHPATAGLPDDHNRFGVSIGASLSVRWPARPLLIGRWGWTDFGDEGNKQGKLGNWRYDPGEKLGDIVHVAEQRMGRGRVLAFGDTTSLMNTTVVSTHEFMTRLLAYLSRDTGPAHAWWRQTVGIVLAVLLLGLLLPRVDVWRAGLAALGLAVSLSVCTRVNHQTGAFLPPGDGQPRRNLAIIDASHVETYCDYYWRPDDIGGLVLTLLRNGYLPFAASELTAERLAGAELLISIAPARAFSTDECAAVRDFVAGGGTFILTVGHEEAPASHSLLSEFGFAVGGGVTAPREPDPMGHFKSPYLRSGDRYAHVRFHAAWPVACNNPNARIIANGRENLPVIMMRPVGAGKVVLVGDTSFALNKNLEREDGQPIEGQRENADFWRWLITQLRGEPMWVPSSLRDSPHAETGPPGKSDGLREAGP